MSLWNDFWDFVEDTVDDVGDTLSDAWSAVKDNPIGTITSAVAMAYGIPPMWAGALGGAAGAAATGGNVVKAAITGGAMGYMGSAAGAAAGSAGPIAAAAAAGTAASVTGAILTGQDVLTAAKQGLILGTVAGGAVKLMSPTEAISSVPGKSLAELTANSADPLGDLINEMGWTDSNSARAAASQAFSKNAATTQAMLMESIPEYVLQSASKASNPAAYIAEELGWNQNNLTVGAANKATAQYKAVELQQEQAAAQEASKPINQMASSGVDRNDAQLLVDNGYTPADVKSLINKGYTGAELADMASTGVTSNDLLRVTNTTFTPDQVNQFLQSGGSVNEIVGYDGLVKSNAINTNDVQTLIENNVSPAAARSLAYSGKIEATKTLLNNGVSIDNINSLNQNGWDLNKLASQVENRFISGQEIQDTLATNYNRQGINNLLNDTTRLPSPEEVALQQQQEQLQLQQTQDLQAQHVAKMQAAQKLADMSGGYLTAADIVNQNLSQVDVEAYKNVMDQRLGINQPVQPEVTQPTEVAGPVTPEQPNSVDVSNITQEQLNQITQQNNPYMNTNEGTSTAYTLEQQNMYTRLREAGYGVQEAMDMVSNGVATDTTPTRVDVTGTPAFADNPGPAVPHYRTPNTDLATQAQIDNRTATFNQAANAWEVPTPSAQPTPVVPIVVPPTPTPTPTPVAQQPAPQPSVPSQPTTVAQPTVVSSSTRTTYDGSVYKDDQLSDGTVVTTLVSGPSSTGGSGTGTGTNTGAGNTTPPPLTTPKQEVIPPGSSYVAPVEVTPPPTTPPTTTPPPVVEPPIVPIIPPTGTTPPAEDTYRGKYTLGKEITPNVPHTLNPGWITNVPDYYQTTNQAQSKYYWGGHPYQTGSTFDRTLYNQAQGAPATAWGQGYAQTSATPQQIMQAMGNYTPYYNGPVKP